ncbi:MAG: ribosome small subunit-dependent GTPase A [Oscillospiraceae bacterium]|nr:ribosome small subunit-dependent GTPase A [Oscillospiraceae bacterium]MDD4368086.1 ribosome small subunit-dependent GTPase A [Oscillospiraceae bacterium]
MPAKPAPAPQPVSGMIMKGVGGLYEVRLDSGLQQPCRPRGRLRRGSQIPLPGDRAELSASGDADIPWVIDRLCPRHSFLLRPPVANLDCLFLCFSVSQPEPDLVLLDKLLIISAVAGIKPVIIWTKTELLPPARLSQLLQPYQRAAYPCVCSAAHDLPAQELLRLVKGRLIAFAGPSGVGKSTLLNRLLGAAHMETGQISQRLQRGRHTTRHVELFPFAGGYLADTPGFSSLELSVIGLKPEECISGYPEFLQLAGACRYQDCHHLSEPDCAVKALVMRQPQLKCRYDRYVAFRRELDARPGYRKNRLI